MADMLLYQARRRNPKPLFCPLQIHQPIYEQTRFIRFFFGITEIVKNASHFDVSRLFTFNVIISLETNST